MATQKILEVEVRDMDILKKSDLPPIERGHEIWIESSSLPSTPGERVTCRIGFGHNMESDKVLNPGDVSVETFSSRGVTQFQSKAGDQALLVDFTPESEGVHVISATYDAGTKELPHASKPKHYRQFAKMIMPIGTVGLLDEGGTGNERLATGQPLEILPLNILPARANLQVTFQGKPLQKADAKAIWRDGDTREHRTDERGSVSIELDQSGPWLCKVRHSIADESEGRPIEVSITSTLSIGIGGEIDG